MNVMVCGHRPPRIGGYLTPNPTEQWVRSILRSLLEGLKKRHPDIEGITGMALGVDMIFAEVCLDLEIPYTAALPFRGQEKRWPEESQIRYNQLLKAAKSIVVVDEIQSYHSDHFGGKMYLRNKWMVDHTKLTIAVWDGSPGGTASAVKFARKKNDRKILHADPRRQTTRVENPRVEENPIQEMFGKALDAEDQPE